MPLYSDDLYSLNCVIIFKNNIASHMPSKGVGQFEQVKMVFVISFSGI